MELMLPSVMTTIAIAAEIKLLRSQQAAAVETRIFIAESRAEAAAYVSRMARLASLRNQLRSLTHIPGTT
jgi:hypothetical protein